MVCRNCNTNNYDNVKFCARCGAPLFTNNRPDYGNQGYVDPRYANQGYVDPRYADPRYANQGYVDPYGANPGYGYPYDVPVKQPAQGLAVASMVLGIIGLLLSVLIIPIFFATIPALLAIILGAAAKGSGNRSGTSTAGIVCGSISLTLALIFLILVFTSTATFWFLW